MSCSSDKAQRLLDTFQQVLDMPHLKSEFRRQLIVASQRLATKSDLYCYDLGDFALCSENPIAAGGFSDIFKGRLRSQVVALKTIRFYKNDAIEHTLKCISKEVILWRQLSHPNVLPVYGIYRFRKRICIVSPWMKAGDVNYYLKNNPEVNRLQLINDVGEGLRYLHKNRIIHGDLKGANILVNDAGRACLSDFGISSVFDEKILAWISSYTSVSPKGGFVRWQAPEMFATEHDQIINNTIESDVYSWACVCYEIFTGNMPFSNISDSGVILRVTSGKRPSRPLDTSPAWHSWGLTEYIWQLMEECWVTNPKERPTTDQLLLRLSAWLASDERSSASDSVLAPASFRANMGPPTDDWFSVSDLELLLGEDRNPLPMIPEGSYPFPLVNMDDDSVSLNPTTTFGGPSSYDNEYFLGRDREMDEACEYDYRSLGVEIQDYIDEDSKLQEVTKGSDGVGEDFF
ncbi:hypothetical protein H0H81_004761 [Sphagnurus paluster]|uniref:Protein kinase domain-containing protein n=1 Tax=Sphagnurus paluster TaxID=117069 RepID=A0A9P7FUP7_9AGAR|nr:hypothetical protein H0H81_004761 [Sphagnurus paluster]